MAASSSSPPGTDGASSSSAGASSSSGGSSSLCSSSSPGSSSLTDAVRTPEKKKRGGFFARLLRRPEISPEEEEAALFQAMQKQRERERLEFYSTQQIVSNRRPKGQPVEEMSAPSTQQDEASTPRSSEPSSESGARPKSRRPTEVVFSSLAELPEDVQGSIGRMKIPEEILSAHLPILANILSFDDRSPKRRFYTPEQYAPTQVKGYKKEVACNRHPPRVSTPHEVLFKPVPLKEVKKLFKIADFLGEGGFGNVVRARVLQKGRYPHSTVAIKYQDGTKTQDRVLIAQEASIMAALDHPVVVKLFDCLLIHQECWMIMELLEGGTLKAAAESSSEWREDEIAYVASKMLQGLRYMHKHKFVHRDLKNLNVMFTIAAEVKLIDFGLCADLSKGPTIAMVGSPFWMAPEMIRGDFHSYPVDIWSFMVCLLELANKRPPDCRNVKRALFNHAVFGIGENAGLENRAAWTDSFFEFLSLGFQMDPSLRSSAKQLLKHPWLQKTTTRDHMSRMLSQIFTMKTLAISGI